ncbi:hypothetical protein MPH_04168, partial [Macrophomina phaseolina MS6]
ATFVIRYSVGIKLFSILKNI